MFDEKEEIFEGTVIAGVTYLGQIECVEGADAHRGFAGWHDVLACQHQGVGVFDLKQRVEKVSFGIGEYPF